MSNIINFPVKSRAVYSKLSNTNIERIEEFRDSIWLLYRDDVFIKGFCEKDELQDFIALEAATRSKPIWKVSGTLNEFTVLLKDDDSIYKVVLNDKSF